MHTFNVSSLNISSVKRFLSLCEMQTFPTALNYVNWDKIKMISFTMFIKNIEFTYFQLSYLNVENLTLKIELFVNSCGKQ